MSNSIDQHIVGLDFDTSKFDKGVTKATQGIEQFSQAMEKTNETAKKSFLGIEKAAGSTKFSKLKSVFSSIGNSLSSVGQAAGNMVNNVLDKFSAIGTAAKYTFAGVTAAVGAMAISGGIKRAMNIEQARFQLKGLGADVDAVMENVNAAVKGTAYGLDAAAVVAAQLTASGVQAGQGMEHSLQAVAGVAAMTGREYAEIGHIFTTVAGQGQLMTMQLRQLEYSGLNAAAAMAKTSDETSKFFGKTEEEVREMVHQGEVSFEDFSNAMYEAFGEHAKDANNLFTGALANTKAALSRIGAKFAAPGLEYLRDILNAIMPVIDEFNRQITPLVDLFTRWGSAGTSGLVDFLNALNSEMARTHIVENALNVLADGMDRVIRVSSGIGTAIYDAIPNYFKNLTGMGDDINKFGEGLHYLSNKLEAVPLKLGTDPLFGEFNYKELQQAGEAVNHILSLTGHDQRENAWNSFKESFPEIAHRAEVASLSLSDLNSEFDAAMTFIEKDPIGHLDFNQMKEASDLVQAILDSPVGDDRGQAIDALKEKFPELADEVLKSSMSFADLKKELDAAAASGEGPLTGFIDKFRLWAFNLEFTNEQIEAFNSIKTGFSQGLNAIGTILSGAFDGIAAAAIPALDFLVSKGLPDLVNGLSTVFGAMGKHLPSAQEFADTLRSIGTRIGEFFTALKTGDTSILGGLPKLFADIVTSIGNTGVFQAAIGVLGELFNTLTSLSFDSFATDLRGFLDFLKEIPRAIIDFVGSGFSKVGEAIKNLNLDFSDFAAVLQTVVVVLAGSKIGSVMQKLYNQILGNPLSQAIKNILPAGFEWKIENAMDILATSLLRFGKTLQAGLITKSIKDVAIAIGILVASLWLLGTIEPADLLKSLAAIAALLYMMYAFTDAIIVSMGGMKLIGAMNFASLAGALISLGVAMLLLSAAVAIFSRLDPYEMAQGLIGVGIALAILVKALDAMAGLEGPMLRAALAMAGMATVLLVMAAAVAIFGHMKIETLVTGFASIAVALGILVGALVLISKFASGGAMIAGAFAMAGLASALLLMAIAIKLVGSMSFDQLAVALVGLGGAFLMLGLALEAFNAIKIKPQALAKLAVALGLIITTMFSLAIIVGMFSSMGLEGVGIGLLGLAGALLVMVGAIALLNSLTTGGGLLVSAAAFAVLSVSMIALAGAISILGSLSLEQMGVALLGLGAGLVFIALAMTVMQGSLAGAAAMMVVALAITLLAPALMLLSSIPLQGLGASLLMIGIAIGIFAVAANLIASAIPAMLGIGAALAELGISALGVGVGLALATAALVLLSTIGAPALQALIENLISSMSQIGTLITEFVTTLISSLMELIPKFTTLGIALITALLSAVETLVPQFINTGMSVILQIIMGLNTYLPVLVQAGFMLMITFVNSIAETIRTQHDAMYEAGKNLFMALLEAMLDTLGHLAEDLGGFIMDIPAYLTGQKQLFADAGTQVATEAVTGAETSMQGMEQAGQQGYEQLMAGLQSGDPSQMASLFQPITDGASESMDGVGEISAEGAEQFKMPWENIGSDMDLSNLGLSMTGSLESVDFGSVSEGKMSELLAPFQDTSGMSEAGLAQGEAATEGLDQGTSEMVQTADSKTGEAVSSVESHSGSANAAGYTVGSNMGSGMYNGIDAWIGSVAEKAAQMVREAKAAADVEAASASPSKEMIKRGKWFGQGFEIGIRDMIPAVAGTSADMVAAGKSAIGDTYSLMSDYVRRIDWDINPTIRPVLDLTDVQSGMSQLQGIMSTYDAMRIGAFGRIVGTSTEGAASNIQNAPTYNFNLDYSSGDDAVTMFMELASMMQSFNRLEA